MIDIDYIFRQIQNIDGVCFVSVDELRPDRVDSVIEVQAVGGSQEDINQAISKIENEIGKKIFFTPIKDVEIPDVFESVEI